MAGDERRGNGRERERKGQEGKVGGERGEGMERFIPILRAVSL